VLEQIKQALFSFFGVKEKGNRGIDEQIQKSGMPSMKTSREAIEAWEKAGRPNPQKFFARYKNKKKRKKNG